MNAFGFKTNKLTKKRKFLVKRGLQQNVFLLTCVLQNVKSYRFGGGPFLAKIWLKFPKHYKFRYFGT